VAFSGNRNNHRELEKKSWKRLLLKIELTSCPIIDFCKTYKGNRSLLFLSILERLGNVQLHQCFLHRRFSAYSRIHFVYSWNYLHLCEYNLSM